MWNRFIQSFTQVPKELFRVNTGPVIRLRAYPGPARPDGVFDLLTTAGKAQPKALNPASYEFPNGASMRPNTAGQQRLIRLVRTSSGSTIYVYAVPAGSFPKVLEFTLFIHLEFYRNRLARRSHYRSRISRPFLIASPKGDDS
ncbi:hypothetical protein N7535_002883 [Penicillium sp. DV-2018c]|nr:hypothetical protein N7461_001432 [Penicillium sp. DV-2018c]KAJ5575957.1 hypothetical protein N7535_002883 [Penicillium sp. DV-2018c]